MGTQQPCCSASQTPRKQEPCPALTLLTPRMCAQRCNLRELDGKPRGAASRENRGCHLTRYAAAETHTQVTLFPPRSYLRRNSSQAPSGRNTFTQSQHKHISVRVQHLRLLEGVSRMGNPPQQPDMGTQLYLLLPQVSVRSLPRPTMALTRLPSAGTGLSLLPAVLCQSSSYLCAVINTPRVSICYQL